MQGTIRTLFGLLVVIGCAGGLDNATDAQLLPIVAVAAVGLAIMASGVNALKGNV